MRAAVIDDQPVCQEKVKKCLERYCQENYAGELPGIECFTSGEEFLAHFSPEAYDLIFIDQYMAGLTGLDTARKIREIDRLVALVFVTTSREHAVDSFGVRASGYLVKPYTYSNFERTMELCGVAKIRNARFVWVGKDKLLLREILWCDQDDHYVQIHTKRRGLLRFRISFGELTRLLAPYAQFLACYKGCLVNLDRVERVDGLDFVMDSGERVPFNQREKRKIEAFYHDYLFQREREDELW